MTTWPVSTLARRRRRVAGDLLLGSVPDFARNRVAHLFGYMADQTDGPRNDRNAAADLPRKLQLAQDRADRAGGVDRKRACEGALGVGAHRLHQGDVAAAIAVALRDREQNGRARVDRLVDRMADPRNRRFASPMIG